MDKFIAFTSYCKNKELTIPTHFDIEGMVNSAPKEMVRATGYKFSESYLDEVVPKLGFSQIKKRKSPHERLVLYKLNNDLIIGIERAKDEIIEIYKKRLGYDFVKDMKLIKQTIISNDRKVNQRNAEIIKSIKALSKVILGFDTFEQMFGKKNNAIAHLTISVKKKEQSNALKNLALTLVD
jgi:hypothetical protein